MNTMPPSSTLVADIKSMLVNDLMLQITPDQIGDDQPLFGPGSLGLDSIDALQLIVALEKNYGLKISDSAAARKTMHTVNDLAAAIEAHQTAAR